MYVPVSNNNSKKNTCAEIYKIYPEISNLRILLNEMSTKWEAIYCDLFPDLFRNDHQCAKNALVDGVCMLIIISD